MFYGDKKPHPESSEGKRKTYNLLKWGLHLSHEDWISRAVDLLPFMSTNFTNVFYNAVQLSLG